MIAVYIALCLVVGYIFGCISTAYIVGKVKNIDIREHGSQNAGTTNAMRTLGKKAGIIVFLGDSIKAVLAMLLMFIILKNTELDIETIKLATGFGAVLGHNFPFWLNFKGGKGIAVTGAVILSFCLPVHWACPAIAILLFTLIIKITKYVSLGSLAVVTTFLAYNAIVFVDNDNYIRIVVLTFLFTLSGFFMHRANIKRLLNGTENKVGAKKNVDVNQSINNNVQSNVKYQNMNNNMQGNMMNQNMYNNMQGNMMNQNMNNNMQGNMMNQNMYNNMQGNMMNQNMYNNIPNNKEEIKTSNLYTPDYLEQVKNYRDNSNNIDKNEHYKAYDSCDTVDETRALSESELTDNNYYKNI